MAQQTNNLTRKNGAALKRATYTLGPVENLEEHVHPNWWRNIFNSLYLKTDSDVVEDKKLTRREVDVLVDLLQVKPEDQILDLCCGQGRHSLELAHRGYKVEGLDRSHYLIQKAKTTVRKEGANVKFREGDARKLPYPTDMFEVVLLLGNSFGYFETVQDDLRVLQEVFRVLKPWGKVLIDVADGEYLKQHFRPRTWEWIDKKLFVCRERSLSLDKQRLISREVVTHVTRGVIADQFYAERLYTRKELAGLMQNAGFSDISLDYELTTQSGRNQDLGMMARRIIITGLVRKEWTPVKTKTSDSIKHVAVVLGDPEKLDPLKPLAVFDEDDLYTIDQLKSALRTLPGYRFTYLTNHNTLITDLTKLSGKVDYILNLCDEGFDNNPRKELHVPALLEMVHLPYTGSAPQCLAYCYDKSLVRGIAAEMGIPVPAAFFIEPEDTAFELPVHFPVIAKPNFGDSSFGITQQSVANSFEELINAISDIRGKFGYDKPILVEEFLTGKDLSVGILGNPPDSYLVLPIIEEDYSELPDDLPRICGYEAKWLPSSPYRNLKSVAAELPRETEKYVIECCIQLSERLECRDYVRFDWRLDAEGKPKLLEANPNPGWCWDGHLAKMAALNGYSYPEMLRTMLQLAEQRMEIEQQITNKVLEPQKEG